MSNDRSSQKDKNTLASRTGSSVVVLRMSASHLEVSATLLEALSQHGDHVFVVVQQLLHQFTEPGLLVLILDLQTETHTSNSNTHLHLFVRRSELWI